MGHDSQEQKPLKELSKELKKYTKRFIVYFIFTLFDTILGSLLFLYIEHCYDPVLKPLNGLEKGYTAICDIMENVNLPIFDENNNTEKLLQINDICSERNALKERNACELSMGTFSKWFEYTASIAFTTGYGHVVTRSSMGKIVTMFYLIPTIAFTIVSYIHAANMLITMSKIIILLLETHIRKVEKVKYYQEKVFALQLLVTFLLIIGSAFFYTFNDIDQLTFLDSMYFTLTSLTTIGFGDFTLDFTLYLNQPHLFLILCFLWFFGMGMVASIIAGLGEMVGKYKFGNLLKRVNCQHLRLFGEPTKNQTHAHEHESCDGGNDDTSVTTAENNNVEPFVQTIENEHFDDEYIHNEMQLRK